MTKIPACRSDSEARRIVSVKNLSSANRLSGKPRLVGKLHWIQLLTDARTIGATRAPSNSMACMSFA
jgi:hypothetical protein